MPSSARRVRAAACCVVGAFQVAGTGALAIGGRRTGVMVDHVGKAGAPLIL